jgi:hypothetical protein
MAKMFYTLEETAAKLGVDQDRVKAMAASGRLQQFRDRDKLMFKREQVEALVGGSAQSSTGPIPLADSGDTDAIDLRGETGVAGTPVKDKSGDKDATRTGTGVSIFETGEVEMADPMAQTQVTQGHEDELALESVGSGSGLLDLTRESDDTSLGAELLDEIYPGGGTGAPSDSKIESGIGSSGIFESALGMETGGSGVAELAGLQAEGTAVEPAGVMPAAYEGATADAASSGLGAGLLLGTLIALVLLLLVTISALVGVTSPITSMMAQSTTTLLIWVFGLLVVSALLGGIGMFLGKATSR